MELWSPTKKEMCRSMYVDPDKIDMVNKQFGTNIEIVGREGDEYITKSGCVFNLDRGYIALRYDVSTGPKSWEKVWDALLPDKVTEKQLTS